MTSKRSRSNGEGSIFPYRNGYAAYAWVDKPDGTRNRKYVYGKSRDEVHDKWIKLQTRARQGPVATRVPTVEAFTRVLAGGDCQAEFGAGDLRHV
jgi:hypothetical protein